MVGLMKGVKPRTVLARPIGWIVVPGTRRRYQRLLSGASGLGPHSQKRAAGIGDGLLFPQRLRSYSTGPRPGARRFIGHGPSVPG